MTSLGQQLTNAVNGASFNGLNLLNGSQDAAPLNFVSGYNVTSGGTASFTTIALQTQGLTGNAGVPTTSAAADITNATTIASIVGLATTTNALSYGNDVITATTGSTTASGTVKIQSESLSGVTTTTTYTAVNADGNATALTGTGAPTAGVGGAVAALHVSITTTPPGGLLTQSGVNLTNLTVSATNVASTETAVNAALAAVTSYASVIGSTANQMTEASTFNSALTDNYTTGISALVDADMNQASTRLQALQTQQQLGVQSLSIANQSSQLILKLFQ